jgi:hypothetical protein
MANSYKISQVTLDTANSDEVALRGTASTTLVKGIYFSDDYNNTTVTLSLHKSGGTNTQIREVSHTAGDMTQLLPDTMALESGDILNVQSTHVTASNPGYAVVNYVEDTESVSGQSIGVLTDVDLTGLADGDALIFDSNSGNFEPGTAGGGNVDSVNGATGTVVLDVEDLDNVAITTKTNEDVIVWDGNDWVTSQRLALLYELLKEGTSKTITAEPTNADETEGFVKLEATNAKLKVNKTGVDISETSPGAVTFQVATDSSGTTEFDAAVLTGLNTADEAQFIMKYGTQLVCESSNQAQGRVVYDGTGNSLLKLPASSGQIANTSDIATDSAVVANTAKVSADGSVTTHNDVSSAGSGSIITSTERTKLTGIANGATANQTDAHLLNRSNHTGTQTASTISDFANAADLRIASASVEDLNDITDAGSGEIITSAERTKLTGIANGATANDTDANLKNRANHTGTQTASTISDFNTQADARIAAASFLDLSDAPASYIPSRLVSVNTAGNALSLTSKRLPYSDSEIEEDQNRIFDVNQTGGTDTVRDFLNDTAASASGTTAKNFLGWWDGTTLTIEGMVNTGAAPVQGSSVGGPLWLSTSGAISASAPTTANYYSRIVGYHVGTDPGGDALIYFKPSPDWVQIDS